MKTLSRDSVILAYKEAGSGDPPLLLVHGWTCDHTFMQPQFDHFQKDHRVVAVDLRGHGQSDQPEQDYTMRAFADDVAWLCAELRLEKPVVVGHSMGGLVALELAASRSEVPGAIVLLDSPVYPPGGITEVVGPFIEALASPEYASAQRAFVADRLFLPGDDAAVKERTLAAMSSASQRVMVSAFRGITDFDSATAGHNCKVPTLLITASGPPPNLGWFLELCEGAATGQTVGAGHFHQLLVPDQVNAMIERFITQTSRAPA